MKASERKALEHMLRSIKHPAIAARSYDSNMKLTVHVEMDEVNRRLDSADFKLGWSSCYEKVEMFVNYILKGEE